MGGKNTKLKIVGRNVGVRGKDFSVWGRRSSVKKKSEVHSANSGPKAPSYLGHQKVVANELPFTSNWYYD